MSLDRYQTGMISTIAVKSTDRPLLTGGGALLNLLEQSTCVVGIVIPDVHKKGIARAGVSLERYWQKN
jgi:hypothetical protein